MEHFKSALSHLNLPDGLDMDRLKKAVSKTKARNTTKSKKSVHPQHQQQSPYHHHTLPQHRINALSVSDTPTTDGINHHNDDDTESLDDVEDISILTILSECDPSECSEQNKWPLIYCLKVLCRYLTFLFVGISVIAIALIVVKKSYHHHYGHNGHGHGAGGHGLESVHRANELTGMETLKLLFQNTMGSILGIDGNVDDEMADLHISVIQSMGRSTVFLRSSESNDDRLRFVPFRKPLDSECASKGYSFQRECVNVHNVRDVVFHPKHSELEFLVSGSFPRSVEIDRESEVILNHRRFGISDDGQSIIEWTHSRHYQDGAPFCGDGALSFVRDDIDGDSRIVIGGGCYGLLYLPRSVLWNDGELQLLSSRRSSIIVDSSLSVSSLIVAANNEGSIVFRDKLAASTLTVALTDSAYLEMKEVVDADYVSMITLEGAQIYIGSLTESDTVDFAARNHSLIETANVLNVHSLFLSLSHFSTVRIPNLEATQLSFGREPNARIHLPHPYGDIQNDRDLADSIVFL